MKNKIVNNSLLMPMINNFTLLYLNKKFCLHISTHLHITDYVLLMDGHISSNIRCTSTFYHDCNAFQDALS